MFGGFWKNQGRRVPNNVAGESGLHSCEKLKGTGLWLAALPSWRCSKFKQNDRIWKWVVYGWYTGIPYTQKKYDDKPSRYIGYPLFRQADIIIVHTSTCKNWVNVPAWSIRFFLFGCLGKPDFVESEVVALLETVEHGVQACYSLNGLVLRKIYRKNMVLPSK